MFASGFSIFHLIPAVDHDTLLAPLGIHHGTYLVCMAWFICFVIIGIAGVARLGLNSAMARPGLDKYLADKSLTPRTLAEVVGAALLDLFRGILGKDDAKKFFPYLAALFTYILVSNMMGAFPGLLPPTDNLNNNVGLALLTFLVFNAVGLFRAPIGYLKHLLGPVTSISPSKELVSFLITLPLAFLLLPIEVFGLVLRPFTLTVRLTANMYGDHAVFTSMADLFPVGVPAIFVGFGLFVSFIQAFVFTLLTTIYIGLAKPHEHHDEHEEHAH